MYDEQDDLAPASSWGVVICDVDDDGNPVSVRHREGSFSSDEEALEFVQAPSVEGPPSEAILAAQTRFVEDLWEKHHRACGFGEREYNFVFGDPSPEDYEDEVSDLPAGASYFDIEGAYLHVDEMWRMRAEEIIERLVEEESRVEREQRSWTSRIDVQLVERVVASTRCVRVGDRGPARSPSRSARRVVRTTASGPPGRRSDDDPASPGSTSRSSRRPVRGRS